MSTTVNVPLLRETMAQIEAHPEEWNQESWRCESGMCFAGWAATLAGHEWAHDAKDANAEYLLASDKTVRGFPESRYNEKTGEFERSDLMVVSADTQAQADLGIGDYDAEVLFDGNNDLEALREFVERLAAGEHLYDDYYDEEDY